MCSKLFSVDSQRMSSTTEDNVDLRVNLCPSVKSNYSDPVSSYADSVFFKNTHSSSRKRKSASIPVNLASSDSKDQQEIYVRTTCDRCVKHRFEPHLKELDTASDTEKNGIWKSYIRLPYDVLRHLLSENVVKLDKVFNKRTLLRYSFEFHFYDNLEMLLEYGVNPNTIVKDSRTILHYTAQSNNLSYIQHEFYCVLERIHTFSVHPKTKQLYILRWLITIVN